MRFLLAATLLAVLATPALAARTSTPVRVLRPAPGNATVAGFELKLVKQPAAAPAAVKLPKGISVFAVLAKQKRTDRVRGVLVVVSRADAVKAQASGSTVLVQLHHAAIPSGFKTTLGTTQRRNVLSSGRAFKCLSWFRTSDLRKAVSLGGPALPGLSARDAVTAACAAAKSGDPFPGEGEFRQALNAPSGSVAFTVSPAAPTQLNATASFNYPVKSFSVLADHAHSFTACSFAAGSCRLLRKSHYAVLKLAQPAAANTPLAFALGLAKAPKPDLPFEFAGTTTSGKRQAALLTSGP